MVSSFRGPVIGFLFFLVLTVQAQGDNFTKQEARDLALKARFLIESVGIEKARPMLHDLSGPYRRGEKGQLYVSVIDWDGVWLAYSPRPAGIGKSVLKVKDPDGKYPVMEMIKIARTAGEGWCEYRWLDPKTNRIRPRVAYVARIKDQEMYVTAGIYK